MPRTRDAEAELNLPPGFRFHPTDEELVVHYLCRKAAGQCQPVPIIAEIDLYKFDPWELPAKALFGKKEWYFFTPRERKYPNGSRPNRAAGTGYWKATGADKPISACNVTAGIKKALVFYSGKAPQGVKTDWIMHEYRLADAKRSHNNKGSLRLDDWVLCRLYNKKNTWEKMQQPKEEKSSSSSFVETMDLAYDTVSDSFRTAESDVDSFCTTQAATGPQQALSTSCMSFGLSAVPITDAADQDRTTCCPFSYEAELYQAATVLAEQEVENYASQRLRRLPSAGRDRPKSADDSSSSPALEEIHRTKNRRYDCSEESGFFWMRMD